MIGHLPVLLSIALTVGTSQTPQDGLERVTELVKQAAVGRGVVEYRPGEPILVHYRVSNPSAAPVWSDRHTWFPQDLIRLRMASGALLRRDDPGEDEPESVLPDMRQMSPGGPMDSYMDLTLLYTPALPEEGELDVFLPWPAPGRTQRICVAPRPGDAKAWRPDYLSLQRIKRWIHFHGNEPEKGTRVDPPVGLRMLEDIARKGGYLREWAMYYKGLYIVTVMRDTTQRQEWTAARTRAFREFLEEYPESQAAPWVRRRLGLPSPKAGGAGTRPEVGQSATVEGRAAGSSHAGAGPRRGGTTGSEAASAARGRGATARASGTRPPTLPGPERRSRRTPFLLVAGLAAVAAAASAVVIARRHHGR